MLDMSLSEVAVIVTVAVVAIGPKDLPKVMRGVARFIAQLKEISSELRGAFRQLAKESGLEETQASLNREMRQITGDDGKTYEAYDMPDLRKPPHE